MFTPAIYLRRLGTAIAINAGNSQTANVSSNVATAPSVLVTDGRSNPVPNVTVTFSVTAGGGSVSGGTATTNSSGIATVTSWTLGASAGANTLNAAISGLQGVSANVNFSATAVVPVSLTFRTSANDDTNAAASASYTYAGVSIGTAASDRRVHVAVHLNGGLSGTDPLPTVTIGGVSATKNVSINGGNGYAAIFTANVTTGTTASIVITMDSGFVGTCLGSAIGVWTSTGLSSSAAVGSATSTADPGSLSAITVNNFAIGAASVNGANSETWSGATEQYDASSAESRSYSGAHTTSTGSISISADHSSASTDRAVVAASF